MLQVVNLTGYDSPLGVGLSSVPCVFVLGSRLKGQQYLVIHMMPIYITTFQASVYDTLASVPLAKVPKSKGREIFSTHPEVMANVCMCNIFIGK